MSHDDDDDDKPVTVTRGLLRRIMSTVEEAERRQWLWKFIGRVSTWITAVAAAVVVVQSYLGKLFR